jgi:aminoglycoside phosphotransferase (APT) family kinase protein
MAAESDSNQGAGAIRTQVDEVAVAAWLAANVTGYQGQLSIDQFNGGQSNPTYRLNTPYARYVLRRKPPGEILRTCQCPGYWASAPIRK